jgi:hypothetical protein
MAEVSRWVTEPDLGDLRSSVLRNACGKALLGETLPGSLEGELVAEGNRGRF